MSAAAADHPIPVVEGSHRVEAKDDGRQQQRRREDLRRGKRRGGGRAERDKGSGDCAERSRHVQP
eukprot:CAMPEP_0169459128 /NCGR_PEP_ID=MMETSP1042-20121227/17798_1 /TAXON_ID=464988 /ORGANISM="Hemiselmis andersenii, Strain CCMP1180" /LENGTH=64 /DNA_ID=CAMNT_0009571551 /DNA_START=255 /DNA_END=448 /DNA_ORIENTATION=-